MAKILSAALKVEKARASLVMAHPFFGSLCLRLKIIEDPTCKSMQTNGAHIKYSPKWVDSLSVAEVSGVLAHEVMHCAFLHQTRRGGRKHTKWNRACDYAINPILSEAGFSLPKGGLNDPQYKDRTAEAVFTMLPDIPGDDDSGDPDPGGCGEVVDSDAGSESEVRSEESDWKVSVAQAAYAAKQSGKLPGSLDRMIQEIMVPVLPWKDILRRFMTEKSNDDFSWRKGNRRFLSSGLYLPSRESEGAGVIAVMIDTSGSISEKELNEFGAEIRDIHKDVRPSELVVIYCDADVNHVDRFGPDDEVLLKARGGGGTDFRPPFVWLRENSINPKVSVYLTDGYGPFPTEDEIDFPTMWAINNTKVTPPLGEHLILEV